MKKHVPKNHHKILHPYQRHLCEVVGLSPQTCQNHLRDIRSFLAAVPIRRVDELAKLTPVNLTDYLTARSADYEPASLRQVAGSLRHFLRFAQQQGWTSPSLSLAVPKIACRTQHDLPAYLSVQQLELLLGSWDRHTAEGRRDLAISLCLTRLGLRAGEVAALMLEDLNWRQGTLRLNQSKNGNPAQLPVLSDVGKAIADYLRAGRPACRYRQVFLWHQPARPMDRRGISQVIRRGLRQCGIVVPHPGAHVLRHTLASHLVQNGASLKEVADLLRHRHLNSAAVYAHLDVAHLRPLAQPWPKEASL
ncbi:MAG: site-specific integrase [Actinomycetota bacterium]